MEIESNPKLLESLLSKSYKEKSEVGVTIRSETSYENLSDRFVFKDKNFSLQYAHLYFSRLSHHRPLLENKLKALHLSACRVIEVKNDAPACTIGTLYKEMKLKPNVLHKLNQEQALGTEKFKDYTSDDDTLYLEDETGRLRLNFQEYLPTEPTESGLSIIDKQYTPKDLITGLVLAIQGRTDKLGVLYVHRLYFCDVPNNPSDEVFKQVNDGIRKFVLNPKRNFTNIHDFMYYVENEQNNDKFVAILSGLNMRHDQPCAGLQNFKQFIFGDIPSHKMRKFASKISKIVFAGNTLHEDKDLQVCLQGAFKVEELYARVFQDMKKSLESLDDFCSELSQNVTLDIMPGDNDPTDDALPQQPINRAYFRKGFSNGHLNAVTNPYLFRLENTHILGTSGKNVQDLMQYSNFSENEIDVLEAMLYWRNIAPTAPDTLKCHPFDSEDPFLMSELPHVYFAGNMKKFDTKLFLDTKNSRVCRLITIPTFSETNSFVVLNLRTLDTFEVHC